MASKRFSVQHRAPALRAVSVLLVLFVSCALLMLGGCGSGSSHALKVSLASSASGSTVDAGSAAVTITATVTNDSKNGGVTFSLSPATGCGSIPASSTGTSVVYTPQSAATLNADCAATITATSVSSPSISNTLSLTVKAITVSFVNPPTTTTLTAGASPITMTAAFAHDTATDTVKWSISSGCGTLAPKGTSAVYTPPSASLAAQCKATIAAASTVNPNLSSSQTASIVFTVNPVGALVINTTSLPGGVVNVAYSTTLQASGGTTPYTWSVASGSSLPSWMTLSTSGTLSGTPTASGTSNFTVEVTDATTPTAQSKTQALSVTVTASVAACGSGSESALKGQYAFSLSGYNSTGFLAAIGSFTADGSGHITAGIVDSNGALGVKSDNITASSSSYSVGSDNRGCATIVTPFYTFTTRFALEPTFHATGNIEEWEPGSTPYIASGEILKQSVPSALTAGVWVYQQLGVYSSSAARVGVIGTITANGSGTYTAGEYDSNEDGVHHSYTGLTGSYGAVDQTTGRYLVTSSLDGITAHRAEYMVSSQQFLELTTDATSSVLIGKGELQSGSLTISGNLVYYATGMESSAAGSFAQIGRATVTGTSTLTANVYEDNAGTWATSTASCNYAIDSYGKVTTSGTNCGTYPPVFYLINPNKGFMLGTEPGVLIGRVDAQLAKTISAATYYFGTLEVVNHAEETTVGSAALTGTSVSGLVDTTSASAPEQGGQTLSLTLTVNSDGTFSTSDHPGVTSGIVISTSQLILVNKQGSAYPTVLVINTVPTA